MKTTHPFRIAYISCALFYFCSSSVVAQKTMLYPNLEKGKYDIGYKSIIDFDYSRTYNLSYPNDTSSQKRDPRPILINIWYPTKATKNDKSMLYGDYIKIQTQDVSLKTFTKRIEEYNSKNSITYMFYQDSLKEGQEKQFTSQLNLPIKVFKDAAPVNAKFPLVIYHAGLGGTLNDNTVLCEYIASHGFVVMTGAFQNSDYKNMNLDWDVERSTKDIDFMLNRIKNLTFIDFSKIAAIGHSFGAQAVLAYKTEDFSPISCLIILDTTMDYSFDANPEGFEPLTEILYKKIKNINVPMLVFANPEATFKVIDSLKYSGRIYSTIQLEHNDFTSLTSLAKRNGLLKRTDSDTVWNKYTFVVNYCLNYLKYNIFKDDVAKQFVLSKHPFASVYEVPIGNKLDIEIPEYSDYSKPPTAMQFKKLMFDKNIKAFDKLFNTHPDYLREDLINDAGYSAFKKDIDFAIYLLTKNIELYPKSWNAWDSLGEGYMIKGEKEAAIKYYTKSVELNPKNKSGIKMLEKLKQ